jgi:hypothetical protein
MLGNIAFETIKLYNETLEITEPLISLLTLFIE